MLASLANGIVIGFVRFFIEVVYDVLSAFFDHNDGCAVLLNLEVALGAGDLSGQFYILVWAVNTVAIATATIRHIVIVVILRILTSESWDKERDRTEA